MTEQISIFIAWIVLPFLGGLALSAFIGSKVLRGLRKNSSPGYWVTWCCTSLHLGRGLELGSTADKARRGNVRIRRDLDVDRSGRHASYGIGRRAVDRPDRSAPYECFERIPPYSTDEYLGIGIGSICRCSGAIRVVGASLIAFAVERKIAECLVVAMTDSTEFEMPFPCYLPMSNGAPQLIEINGNLCLTLFTNKKNVERFCRASIAS